MKPAEKKTLAGCCGIYCGLCPRFQSKAPSRCPGCKILSQTISCKRYNCCVKEKRLSTCAECDGFPCGRYDRFFQWDSFVSHKVCLWNIARIRETDLMTWLREQDLRRTLLERLLADYNEGRSASFLCMATALMPVEGVEAAVANAERTIANDRIAASDVKARARIVRAAIQRSADEAGMDLKLRHAEKQESI